jgi:hypothetical protein
MVFRNHFRRSILIGALLELMLFQASIHLWAAPEEQNNQAMSAVLRSYSTLNGELPPTNFDTKNE